MDQVYAVIRGDQETRQRMEWEPQWFLDKSVTSEPDSNWSDAYESVPEETVSRGADVITSHFLYKLKKEENGKKRLKVR